ncbi:MAG: hypothetical protein M1835_002070 [Candelina submexicana]|nr:MAG: hypothetical protein M1835_002070 [Candelina submexicana]
MASSSKRPPNRKSSGSHRSTPSSQKTEVLINVYDLLPPGSLSSILWTIGGSLLHSGVVINDKEYAYGGHDRPNLSGVYWTKPKLAPPGGTFRCELLHGFTLRSESEIEEILKDTSNKFQGTSYNLLTNNCNHFTSYLCNALTSRPAPAWLNRAASIGVALPCVVPRDWIEPPDSETVDGELLDEDVEDERAAMLRKTDRRRSEVGVDLYEDWESENEGRERSRKGKGKAKDTSGRTMPASERAPAPGV